MDTSDDSKTLDDLKDFFESAVAVGGGDGSAVAVGSDDDIADFLHDDDIADFLHDDESIIFGPVVEFTKSITTHTIVGLVDALNAAFKANKIVFDLEATAEGGIQAISWPGKRAKQHKTIRFNFGASIGVWPPLSPTFSLESWRKRPAAVIWQPLREPSVEMLLARKAPTGPGRGWMSFEAYDVAPWSKADIDKIGAVFEGLKIGQKSL